MNQKAVIGVVGLAVMGENLALNFANHGFQTAVYNRTTEKPTPFSPGAPQGNRSPAAGPWQSSSPRSNAPAASS